MPKKILLVEDDPDILDLLNSILAGEGYDTLLSTGDDAFNQAAGSLPDLVLLDHRLRTLYGADICRLLKAGESTHSIPVIMMSAVGELAETARGAGADAVLPKPFDLDELLGLVAAKVRRA